MPARRRDTRKASRLWESQGLRGKYKAVLFFSLGPGFPEATCNKHCQYQEPITWAPVNTNNGTEAQNKLFKYGHLPTSFDKSVYSIAIILVESFIQDSYQHYLQSNLKSPAVPMDVSCSHTVPVYLHDLNRPPRFVKHCLNSRFAATKYQPTHHGAHCQFLERRISHEVFKQVQSKSLGHFFNPKLFLRRLAENSVSLPTLLCSLCYLWRLGLQFLASTLQKRCFHHSWYWAFSDIPPVNSESVSIPRILLF